MIARMIDGLVSTFRPDWGLARMQSRRVMRGYQGAESTRLTANKTPKNQPADAELRGPNGADAMRAWARMLIRDNAYAWSALESIVSETIGSGIGLQSAYETPEGDDVEEINERRDAVWAEWCEVCDINGQLTFDEIQTLAFREMSEAGECLIHMVTVPKEYNGIYRPVPLALELIEADRIANDRDNYQLSGRKNENRVVRGVEYDELGKPVAYWVYPEHPASIHAVNREPVRLEASNVRHLFRRDRIGQGRGISWFAPVVQWLRDLGVYVDNEMQASAVASCYVGVIKTETPMTGLGGVPGEDTTDANGNQYDFMEPGRMYYLNPNESIDFGSPGRPNAAADPWIALILRAIAAGTGTSYESVSKDFSNTSYSSARTSKLENRPRYRRWQKMWINNLCQPVWDRFNDAAAFAGLESFPTMTELLTDRRRVSAVEFMPPIWEWVDVSAEQQSSEASIAANQSTFADEIGKRGGSWRRVAYQRAKEQKLFRQLGLTSPADADKAVAEYAAQNQVDSQQTKIENKTATEPAGEMAGLSTQQFNRNRKAIDKILNELASGQTSEAKARVYLSSIGMKPDSIEALIQDALDGSVDTLPEAVSDTQG